MIKSKLAFFQMEIESVFLYSPETNQASLCIGPKTFYTVNMATVIGKLVFSVLHPVVFLIAEVYKAVIAAPTVRVDNTFRVYTPTNNALQSSSGAVRNYFSVNTPLSFEQAKNYGFSSGSSSSKASNLTRAKVAFINFNLARNRRFCFTGKGNAFSYSLE